MTTPRATQGNTRRATAIPATTTTTGTSAAAPPTGAKEGKKLLRAAGGERLASAPIWLMRQAGRYLPEYRAIRAKHDTLTMFRTPRLAAEITLQPLARFPLDAAIVYADILLIPDALGYGLSFVQGEGPKFEQTVRKREDLRLLREGFENRDAFLGRLSYVAETLDRVREGLVSGNATLIGFAGAPWTVASYLIEGCSHAGDSVQSKRLLLADPHLAHEVLGMLTELTIDYLRMQVAAGAEIVQLFESWAGSLAPAQYETFALPYARKIIEALEGDGVPVIHFLGEGAGVVREGLSAGASVHGVDWRQRLSHASRAAAEVRPQSLPALQGNLDPAVLFAPTVVLQREALRVLEEGFAHPGGFIFNLGHGIRPDTPVENVGFLVNLVHNHRRPETNAARTDTP